MRYLILRIFLDDIYEAIIEEYPLSAILSDNVKEQVATVESELSAASKPEHRLRLTNALSYDRNLAHTINLVMLGSDTGGKLQESTRSVYDDINPLIIKLKYFYNQPRPNQYAHQYKMRVYPMVRTHGPSFPSGHAIQALVLCEVFSNLYVDHAETFKNISTEVALSRVYLGASLPDDIDFGNIVANKILSSGKFNAKYSI